MGFRDKEKGRLARLKSELFSAEASEPGTYKGKRYEFCFRNDRAAGKPACQHPGRRPLVLR